MRLAYLDTAIWITRVEGLPTYREQIDKVLSELAKDDWIFCISDAVIL